MSANDDCDAGQAALLATAVEIGGKAIDVLLARFDDTMAGKSVSSIQSMK